jgi:primary-amine oxidase
MTLIVGTAKDMDTTAVLPGHPLEPLTPEEFSAAAALLRADDRFPEGTRFVFIELAEPPKDVVLGWTPDTPWDRQAAAVLRAPAQRATYEAVVSLSSGTVVSWRHVEGHRRPMRAGRPPCAPAGSRTSRWSCSTPGLRATPARRTTRRSAGWPGR